MKIDSTSWKFPIEKLTIKDAFLCLTKINDVIECIGFRLECDSIVLPDINYDYQKESKEEPHISIGIAFPFESLVSLENIKIDLGEPVEGCGDDLGSVYLFGAHNPVGWQSIAFGKVEKDKIEAVFDLYFDFDFEDRIGGCFKHTFKTLVGVEKRWEL